MRRLVVILALAAILGGGCGPKEEITLTIPGTTAQIIMRLIPAGVFNMGSPEDELDRESDEGPQHTVTITEPFYMGVYEVTQEQWYAVIGNNPANFVAPGNPIEQVSWEDSQAFIAKLNGMNIGTFRLPTEAEWEYACRAESTARFSFGDDLDHVQLEDYAWYYLQSSSTTHPVGEKIPNAWGLFDMHGNVWEWCSDWYGEYESDSEADPQGPSTGTKKTRRGGAWPNLPGSCRSANRSSSLPTAALSEIGFRIVRTAP